MVRGKWFLMGEPIEVPLAVRKAVLGRAQDALDDSSQQVVVYQSEKVVGTARLYWDNGAFVVDGLCVLQQARGKGFGDLLIRLVLFKALVHQASKIVLTSPKETVSFFEKYGFVVDEETAQGVQMHIMACNVQLSHCGGNCAGCDHQSEECMPKAMR